VEREIIAENSDIIQEFAGTGKIIVLGAGDKAKLQHVLGCRSGAVLIDISRDMIDISKSVIDSPEVVEADFQKIDLSSFGPGCTFVMLGNTLGNMENMKGFLMEVMRMPGAKTVLGIELLAGHDLSSINRIIDEYKNEEGFRFVFTPLEVLGVKRSDGEIRVSFNKDKKRIEEFFEFKDSTECEEFARKMELDVEKAQRILLSISSKLSELEFQDLVRESGLVIKKAFNRGTNFVFLLENPL
jgi:uncharacterized SAM-dependent methyltransferase